MEGNEKPELEFSEQGNLGLPLVSENYRYSRLRIMKSEGYKRMEIVHRGIQMICQPRGTPNIDLFASRISRQLLQYMFWKLDPFSRGQDAFQINWSRTFTYAFPPFALIGRVLRKVQQEQALMIITTPAWQTQTWFSGLVKMPVKNPPLLAQKQNRLKNQEGKKHPLIQEISLRFVACNLSGKVYVQAEYQKGLQPFLQALDEPAHFNITIRLWANGLAGVVKGRYVPLDVI